MKTTARQEIGTAPGVQANPPRLTGDVVRLAQRFDRTRWQLVEGVPDEVLAASGWRLGGPVVDLRTLDDEDRAECKRLLYRPSESLAVVDRMRLAGYLAQCPRSTVPPIDLDLADDIAPAARVEVYGEILRALSFACAEVGLPAPRWSTSGGSGFHGDLDIPDSIRHPRLVEAVGVLVRRAADRCAVPLLSRHRSRDGRPPIVVDDTLYTRRPGSRGVVWRLLGALHPSGDSKQELPDPLPYPPACPERLGAEILDALDEVESRDPSPAAMSPADRAEAEGEEYERAELATWSRVDLCPVCRRGRCRVSPDGTWAYCFRRGGPGSPGQLVDLIEYTRSLVVEPPEDSANACYVRTRSIDHVPDGTPENVVKAARRHAACSLAWAQRECRNPAHDGRRPVLARYPLRCGMPHVCYTCAQAAAWPIRQEARTAVLREHVARGRSTVGLVKLYPPRPVGCAHDHDALRQWVEGAFDLLGEVGRRRRRGGPGCAVLGAEYAPRGEGDPLPYRPVLVVVVESSRTSMIYQGHAAHEFDVEDVEPHTAALVVAEALETLPFLARNDLQKVAVLAALHGRRRVRHYGGLPRVESADAEELADLARVALPEDAAPHSCPICNEPDDSPHVVHLLLLPSGEERPYQPGGLRNPIVLDAIRRDYAAPRSGPPPPRA